jgi:cytochrome c oxidase cbb3-type subunit I
MTSIKEQTSAIAIRMPIISSEPLPIDQPDSASRTWLFSGIFWMSVTMLIGLVEAVKLFYPEFLQGVPALAYGRLRPVHINIGMFGFMSMGYLGATFYMVPRLTQTPLFSERLGSLTAWAWNLNLLAGCLGILLGFSKGKEYTEIPFPFDMAIGLFVIAIAGNLFSTITQRREQRIYVSLWYILLAIIPFPIYYTLGNASKFSGIEDAVINWFYSHNLFGIWLTTLGLATLYYIVPKQVHKPLYSHVISFVGFWTLAAFYPWNGGHHVIWGPVPMWVMTASVTASIAMFIPTFATMVNFGGTAWGTWDIMKRDVSYRFSLLAYLCYVGASLWGTGLAVMSLNAKLHFTNMTIAHVHLGFVGFGVPGVIAFTYFYLERSLKLKYSRSMAEWHFWLTLIGIIGYVVSMGISGWMEGSAWEAGGAPQGTMIDRYPYHVARAISGLVILLGQFLFVGNVIQTINYPVPLETKNEEHSANNLQTQNVTIS